MKPFMSIAYPHDDILEGRLTMDVFAADLWQVHIGKAPQEYKDPELFFKKTFLTRNLDNLLSIAQKRLQGKGGDPIIQLQTPFGGGKTHALIALYHKAKDWKVKVVVLDCTVFDPRERTLWEEIEFQLKGKVELLEGKVTPGRQKLYDILSENQPLLILIDELLEYITKASGIKVGDTSLASQTLAFIQELTTTIKNLDKTLLIITLPSSILEQYDQNAEKLINQIQHIIGRVEKIYTPVEEEEVASVIVKRLFSQIDEKGAKENIEQFLDYAERESLFPRGMDKYYYREKFMKSFPFQPEVIDVLYKRWGSFPSFQRTRGMLRILAMVVHSLRNSSKPFIRLGDIDLRNQEIRRELIKHIGNEYDSILASDITAPDSGAKKASEDLGSAYLSYDLGTKCATTIFMYSFSGGPDRGITLQELKLCCADINYPSSIISDAVEKLREKLFYLSDGGLFFTNQPNLNRILFQKMDIIQDKAVEEEEKNIIKDNLSRLNEKFEVYVWPFKTKDVPDTKKLKLIILKEYSEQNIIEFVENFGDKPRVNRNTLIFLYPLKEERVGFSRLIREKLAWQLIKEDSSLNLTNEQIEEVKNKLKKLQEDTRSMLRNIYRFAALPSKEKLKEISLNISTHGRALDLEVYNKLKSEGEILENLSDIVLVSKYLKNNYVSISNILDSFYTLPGEPRIVGEEVLENSIREGVKKGLFGVGKIELGKPVCKYFKKDCFIELSDQEVIIKPELCEEMVIKESKIVEDYFSNQKANFAGTLEEDQVQGCTHTSKIIKKLFLKIPVPFGRLSNIYDLIRRLNLSFKELKIFVEINAENGKMTEDEYENSVKETLKQIGIEEYVEKSEYQDL